MGEIKTHSTDDSVAAFIGAIADAARREDCQALLVLMQRATGEEPRVWSSGLIGFGTYHYKTSSGQEGDRFPVGFALSLRPRSASRQLNARTLAATRQYYGGSYGYHL